LVQTCHNLFVFYFYILGFLVSSDMSLFLAERLESLSIRVASLEYELREERRKRMLFEGMVSVYGCEFQKILKLKKNKMLFLQELKIVLNEILFSFFCRTH
jgi:hypothetical protein